MSNPQWLRGENINKDPSLFGFCFSKMNFLVFDPSGFGFWSNELTDLIKHNLGSFGDKI